MGAAVCPEQWTGATHVRAFVLPALFVTRRVSRAIRKKPLLGTVESSPEDTADPGEGRDF
ncbi:hypothetical protein D7V80_24140 [Corallococcus sp. CA054B]|nr:hypothetical protein D7V80_24140 [Corallococcus sp. CA054B]